MDLVTFEMSAKDMGFLSDDAGLSQDVRDALHQARPFEKMDYGTPLDFYVLEVSDVLATEVHDHAKRLRLSAVERDAKIALDGLAREKRNRRPTT